MSNNETNPINIQLGQNGCRLSLKGSCSSFEIMPTLQNILMTCPQQIIFREGDFVLYGIENLLAALYIKSKGAYIEIGDISFDFANKNLRFWIELINDKLPASHDSVYHHPEYSVRRTIIYRDEVLNCELIAIPSDNLEITMYSSINQVSTKYEYAFVQNKDFFLQNLSLFSDKLTKEYLLTLFAASLYLIDPNFVCKFVLRNPSTTSFNSFSKILKMEITRDKNEYDFALSFAGEDRDFVKGVADELLNLGYKVFYDEYLQDELWGKDLYQHLNLIYKEKSKYCIIFISEYYVKKLWTKHELKSAQTKAFKENREYILPIRFDNTPVPGLNNTIAYIDGSKMGKEEIARLAKKKYQSETHYHH